MHIPRAVCSEDQTEMTTSRNGVLIEMVAEWGSYYKIYADQVTCPKCEKSILLPSKKVLIEHYETKYTEVPADITASFQ